MTVRRIRPGDVLVDDAHAYLYETSATFRYNVDVVLDHVLPAILDGLALRAGVEEQRRRDAIRALEHGYGIELDVASLRNLDH